MQVLIAPESTENHEKSCYFRVGENRKIVAEKSSIFDEFWVPKWYLEASKSKLGNVVDSVRISGAILMILVAWRGPGLQKLSLDKPGYVRVWERGLL